MVRRGRRWASAAPRRAARFASDASAAAPQRRAPAADETQKPYVDGRRQALHRHRRVGYPSSMQREPLARARSGRRVDRIAAAANAWTTARVRQTPAVSDAPTYTGHAVAPSCCIHRRYSSNMGRKSRLKGERAEAEPAHDAAPPPSSSMSAASGGVVEAHPAPAVEAKRKRALKPRAVGARVARVAVDDATWATFASYADRLRRVSAWGRWSRPRSSGSAITRPSLMRLLRSRRYARMSMNWRRSFAAPRRGDDPACRGLTPVTASGWLGHERRAVVFARSRRTTRIDRRVMYCHEYGRRTWRYS